MAIYALIVVSLQGPAVSQRWYRALITAPEQCDKTDAAKAPAIF